MVGSFLFRSSSAASFSSSSFLFAAAIYPEIPIAAETKLVHTYSKEELDELKKSYDRDRNELSIHYIDTIC